MDYDTVLCFENARYINTGLFFGSNQRAEICKLFLGTYEITHYLKETVLVNTVMNKPVIQDLLPELKWNGQSQKIGKTFVVGCEEYGHIMKHHGTRSWCDYLPTHKTIKGNRIKRFLRNPILFEKLEGCEIGRKILPLYTFLSYDLLDLGPMYFLKLYFHNHILSYFRKH